MKSETPDSTQNSASPFAPILLRSTITAAAVAARRRRGKKLQVERSSEMRVRIMEATLECLSERGYADTTFATIANCAGVSRGALQHHYPERNLLIAGALEMLGHQLEPNILAHARKKPAGPKRMVYVLDLLWEASLAAPVTAIQDVRSAARTNKELREMLLPLEHRVREHQYLVTAGAFGVDFVETAAYRRRIDVLFATMRGLAISVNLGWERKEIDATWQCARGDFIAAFTAPQKVAPPGGRKQTKGQE